MKLEHQKFRRMDLVRKTTGDYTFEGHVVSVVMKKSGQIRYVVEDDRGLLFIFNEDQLEQVRRPKSLHAGAQMEEGRYE